MEASHKKHRPHIKMGKDAEEEVVHRVNRVKLLQPVNFIVITAVKSTPL